MVKRDLYINQLKAFIDKPFIKIISGIRRSGKSVLLMLLKDELIIRGISKGNVVYINFESFDFSDIRTSKQLYEIVKGKITNNQKYYLLLDEIQEIEEWEKAINAFRVDFNCDIYITGSNSHLLSSELATFLSGRYVLINIYTLSFLEYLEFIKIYDKKELENIYDEFIHYLRLGGFPVVHESGFQEEQVYKIVYDIYSSIILRDVVQRFKIRDVELLERVVKFVFDNIGNNFSAKKIADYFKSQNRKLDLNTIYNYLNALESSYIIYRIPRYNIRGKEILKTNEKYFIGDLSLLYSLSGYKDRLISGLLENIVMLELKRRGYSVYIGKLDNLEIDFIAEKQSDKIYIQIAYKMTERSTIDREYSPLLKIKNNYPKYVLTLDKDWQDTINGIKHKHIAEFLTAKNW